MNKAGVKTNAGDANASGTLQPVTQATANAEAKRARISTRHQPKPVSISGNMKALSVGAFHGCAVTDAFEAKCWFYDQRMSEAPLGKPSPDSRRFNTTGVVPFIGSTLPSDLP